MQLPLQLSEIRAQLEHAKVEAERLAAGLTEAQLWQPPPDGGWSVGECLAHLNITGEGYLFKLDPALKGAADRKGSGAVSPRAAGGCSGLRLEPGRQSEAENAPDAAAGAPGDVLTRFLTLQDALLALTPAPTGSIWGASRSRRRSRVFTPERL
jgi:hypothetical protein